MKIKIKDTKFWTVLWLVIAIMNYFIFCYDLEMDKDWMTYGWLLWTILSFCMFIIHGVKLEIVRNKL